MSLQETEESQELHQTDVGLDINRFNMLSLNGNILSIATATTTDDLSLSTASASSSGEKCSMCGSMKRRSPSSSSLQPTSKKPYLQSAPSSTANGCANPFRDFTRLPLPAGPWNLLSPSLSTPILRRCASDPVNSPGINTAGDPISQPLSPEDPFTIVSATTTSPSPKDSSASLPPLPPNLRRTVSDLSPTAYQVTGTPPQPSSAARTFSGSPISSERLKRMEACMRGMRQWWDQVLLQDEREDALQDIESPSPVESESEGVSVERNGDWLVIKLECPCAKACEIRLSGQSCYYKLI